MRILFAIKSMNVPGGGAERVLADVANALAGRGHDIGILTFDHPGAAFYDLDPRISRHDAAFNQPGTPTAPRDFLRAIPVMRRMVRQARPDVLVTFMHSTHVPVTLATAGLPLRRVYSEHIDAAHYASRRGERLLMQLTRALAPVWTVPSQSARDSFGAAAARFTVVANPVELEKFAAAPGPADGAPPEILSVGRFMEQKDQITLLRAFAAVLPDFPGWRLRIVGDGTLRGELEQEIARLGLGDAALLPGMTQDMPAAYAACAFVAIPSLYESFGMVAAEALASRRAVLAFDNCSGITEIVRHETSGLLVPGSGTGEARVAAMAQGLRRLMADPGLRAALGAAGPAGVRQFSLGSVVDRWEQIVRQAAGLAVPAPLVAGTD